MGRNRRNKYQTRFLVLMRYFQDWKPVIRYSPYSVSMLRRNSQRNIQLEHTNVRVLQICVICNSARLVHWKCQNSFGEFSKNHENWACKRETAFELKNPMWSVWYLSTDCDDKNLPQVCLYEWMLRSEGLKISHKRCNNHDVPGVPFKDSLLCCCYNAWSLKDTCPKYGGA